MSESEPAHIRKLRATLSQKCLVTGAAAEALSSLEPYLTRSNTPIDNYFERTNTGIDASNALRKVTCSELAHYEYLFRQPNLRDQANFNRNREMHMHALLHDLACYVSRVDPRQQAHLAFNRPWELVLIADVNGEQKQYTPKSDVSLSINKFPHLLLEVISKPDQSDRYRMLVQVACLARVGNAIKLDATGDPFTVSTIYIDDQLCATWHFMYQPNASDTTVECVEETFDLKNAKRLFDFMFQLYNSVSVAIEDNRTLRETASVVGKLSMDIVDMGLPPLTSRARKTQGDDDEGWGPVGSDILEPEVENFESLLPLTAKMHRAESAHGGPVILKLADKHEVEVLQRLHANQLTKQTRIIPVLDVICGRLMVLPQRTPLSHFLETPASVDNVGELALQFLEGVAHLQHSSVAHLDLKLDNIVVRREPFTKKMDLAIIGFNCAVFADAEPTISGYIGTAGWSAPEVSSKKAYDPLLADRWSCGRVLMIFTDRMEPSWLRESLRILSRQLMNPNPSQRPPVPDATLLRLQAMEER